MRFRRCWKTRKTRRATHYACLGDVVGYNANPKESPEKSSGELMNTPCVKGNHDEYMLHR